MTDKQQLSEIVMEFWKNYISEPTIEHLELIIGRFSQNIVLIGTGESEYFTDLNHAINNIIQIQEQDAYVSFEMHDYWQDCMMVAQDVYLVYGRFKALQSVSAEVLINMNTRFSILCHKQDGIWKIIHLHHSIPFSEQAEGEYYPETLSTQAKNAIEKANLYKEKSEVDFLTSLYNKETFILHVEEHLKTCKNGTMLFFDLDKFKQVNDSCGHLAGDKTLKLFSSLLKESFNVNAVLGRMGGDEFCVFEYLPPSREVTIEKISMLLKAFEDAVKLIVSGNAASFSVGIASVGESGCSYDTLLHDADMALYHVKHTGRRQAYHWY